MDTKAVKHILNAIATIDEVNFDKVHYELNSNAQQRIVIKTTHFSKLTMAQLLDICNTEELEIEINVINEEMFIEIV